jgi:putative chitinase
VNLTLSQLRECMPYSNARASMFLQPLNAAMSEFSILTPIQKSAFLAQVAHESGSLLYTREIADGTKYEGRSDLGNTQLGDGIRFRGRGLIQITGRTNTEACLKDLGRGFTEYEWLESPEGASRSAGWFWQVNGLNPIAEAGNFGTLTRRINGGYNGLDERIKHYVRCIKVLGA